MGSVLSKIPGLESILSITTLNNFLRSYNALGLAVLLIWCVPYNYVVKQRLLEYLLESRFWRRVSGWTPYLMLLAVILVWRGLRKSDHDLTDLDRGDGTTTLEAVKRRLNRLARYYLAFLSLVFTIFVSRARYLAENNLENLVHLENTRMEKDMLAWRPPSAMLINTVTGPARALFEPVFIQESVRLPEERPLLLVSNHTLLGLDYPLLLHKLWTEQKVYIRALADHSHFQIPGNASLLRAMGAVDGTRRNVDLLMDAGQVIFVYPGGARETFKRTTDEKYSLIWGNRTGFAELAIRHGATIIPVTNYGSETSFDVVADVSLSKVPIPFLWGSDRTLPIITPTSENTRRRIYYHFGEPIRTDHPSVMGKEHNQAVVDEIRDRTKSAIETSLDILRDYARKEDEELPPVKSGLGFLRFIGELARRGVTAPEKNHLTENSEQATSTTDQSTTMAAQPPSSL